MTKSTPGMTQPSQLHVCMQCLYYTSKYTCIVHVYYTHTISDALIVRSVIGIGHYQPLFLKDVTDIVISVLIMSFLVMIIGLSDYDFFGITIIDGK